MIKVFRTRPTALLLGLAATVAALPGVVGAQGTAHKGLLKRHPTATAAAAGLAAHHIAKHHGHGILHRHPMATGMGAAAIAHHMAKKK